MSRKCLAKSISAQVVNPENRDGNFTCKPADAKVADDACAKEFFTRVGRLLYRRPLSQSELDLAVESAREGAKTYGDFYRGVAAGLVGMRADGPLAGGVSPGASLVGLRSRA